MDNASLGRAAEMPIRRGCALPPGFEDHTVFSDLFRKFSILSDSSRASQICVLTRSDWIRRVLSIELSRFYHGKNDATGLYGLAFPAIAGWGFFVWILFSMSGLPCSGPAFQSWCFEFP
jgi:hypothetical protein